MSGIVFATGQANDAIRRPISGTIVTYDIRVRLVGHQEEDGRVSPVPPNSSDFEPGLRGSLWTDTDLREQLHDEARRLFGWEFRALLLEVKIGDSLHVIVALHAERQTTIVVVDFRQRTSVFGERVRQTIALACKGKGFEVAIDVTATGDILADEAPAPATKEPWDRIGAVLATVATGIGVLGFVAFVGGAIEFGRLEKAGLPAEEAIAVLPNANLISTGAKVLIPALVFALGAALVLSASQLAVGFYYRRLARPRGEGVAIYDLARKEGGIVHTRLAPRLRRIFVEPGSRAAILASALAVLEITVLASTDPIHGFWPAVMIVLIALTWGVVFMIARRSRTFIWVAAASFIASGIFWSTLAYAKTKAELKVRPAVAIRAGNPIRGFFIAETSSEIYLGRTVVSARPGEEAGAYRDPVPRILILAKDEINDFAIGPFMRRVKAHRRARRMARELCFEVRDTAIRFVAKKPLQQRSECDRLILGSKRAADLATRDRTFEGQDDSSSKGDGGTS